MSTIPFNTFLQLQARSLRRQIKETFEKDASIGDVLSEARALARELSEVLILLKETE